MLKGQIYLELSNGELISYEEILSIFDIYNFVQKPIAANEKTGENFILIPNKAIYDVEVIYKANENGITEYKRTPNSFYSEIRDLLLINDKKLIKVSFDNIPQEIQNIICSELINKIPEDVFYKVLHPKDDNL